MTSNRTIFNEVPDKYQEALYPVLKIIHDHMQEDGEKTYTGFSLIRDEIRKLSAEKLKILVVVIGEWESQPATLSWRQALLLGTLFLEGFGDILPQNLDKARQYMDMSESAGSKTAAHFIGHFYYIGADSGIKLKKQDEAKAAEIFYRAGQKGDNAAKSHLVDLYNQKSDDVRVCFYTALGLINYHKLSAEAKEKLKKQFSQLPEKDAKLFDELSDTIPWEQMQPLFVDDKAAQKILSGKWEKLLSLYLDLDLHLLSGVNQVVLSYLCLEVNNYISHAQKQKWEPSLSIWKLPSKAVNDKTEALAPVATMKG